MRHVRLIPKQRGTGVGTHEGAPRYTAFGRIAEATMRPDEVEAMLGLYELGWGMRRNTTV